MSGLCITWQDKKLSYPGWSSQNKQLAVFVERPANLRLQVNEKIVESSSRKPAANTEKPRLQDVRIGDEGSCQVDRHFVGRCQGA